jgi:hypothetical protein
LLIFSEYLKQQFLWISEKPKNANAVDFK